MEHNIEKDRKKFFKKDKINDGYLISPSALPDDIERVEKKLGYKIPKSYKELMALQNGGKLKNSFFQLKDSNGRILKTFKCEYLYGIWDDDTCHCLINKHHNIIENSRVLGNYGFELDGFEIGSWKPDSGWGNSYFYLDYSACAPGNEPRVCVYVMNWSPERKQAIPSNYILAETFGLFMENLISKPVSKPFDFTLLEGRLMEAAKQTIHNLLNNHPEEKIVSFGFYLNEEGSMIAAAANTQQHLQDKLAKYPDDKYSYTYLTTEWIYEGTDDSDLCSSITSLLEEHTALLAAKSAVRTFRKQVMERCVNALSALRKEKFFSEMFGREIVLMVGTSNGDISKEKLRQIIRLLNPDNENK